VSVSQRIAMAIVALTVSGGLGAGCSSSGSSSSRSSSSEPRIVALGDSVPRGTGCGCRPYPQLSADDLAARMNGAVAASNDAVAGATSADVLGQLDSERGVVDDVSTAGAIEVEVGANDVGFSQSCGTSVDCYAPRLPALEKNLAAIVARTRVLSRGRDPVIVLLDYWSVWLGGKYAAEKGAAYVAAAKELTDRVDAIIKAAAVGTGSQYVDLRAAFKGPDYAYDETHYLAPDGDHPNAAGHEQIAKALAPMLAAHAA
jgi:lysophospholipase L1-like esterase